MLGNMDDTVEKPRAERESECVRESGLSDIQEVPAASTAQCGGSHWDWEEK